MTWRILVVALLLQAAAPQRGPEQRAQGSIEGMIVRMGTNEPVEGVVRVFLFPEAGGDKTSSSTTTKDGRFVFGGLGAGKYRLAFAGNGYVLQEYGQRVLNGKGTPIELAADQAIRNLVVRMTPKGAVTGRIQDSDNNPLPHVPVQLLRASYDDKGTRILKSFGTGYTNDRGEYRIYFVTPGQYYVRAGTIPDIQNEESWAISHAVREPFTPMFYPGSADVRNAKLVEVEPGAARQGTDLTLQRQQLFRIRGRVVDTVTGRAPEKVWLQLVYRNEATGSDNWGATPDPAYQQGNFEFRNVPPGTYMVSAFLAEPGQLKRDDRVLIYRTGAVPVDVHSDIDGVVVTLNPTASIRGRVIGPNGQPAPLVVWNISTGGPPQGAHLRPVAGGPAPVIGPQFTGLEDDGTFSVFNLTPGEYVLSIDYLWDQYIKEARFGGVDVLNRPLRFTGSETGPLEIVVSSDMGSLDGKVLNQQLETMSAAQVVLVPDRNRERAKLFRAVTTDAKGNFSIPHIAPGDYKLFAWESLEPNGYFDPELLRRSESTGLPVHVDELSKQTVSLTAMPAPQ